MPNLKTTSSRFQGKSELLKALLMKRYLASLSFLSLLTAAPLLCQTAQTSSSGNSGAAQARAAYGRTPLTFEANKGQLKGNAKFLARSSQYSVLLTSAGMTLAVKPSSSVLGSSASPAAQPAKSQAVNTVKTVKLNLVNATANPEVAGEEMQQGKVNYFIGKDPSQWHTNVPTYKQVRYKSVYPGIDLIYYGNHRQVEYDFRLAAGADPGQIHFSVEGADSVSINADGDLALKIGSDTLTFQCPEIYQETNGQHTPVAGSYVLEGSNQIGFQVAPHDASKPLTIDPVLVYSTYVGGRSNDELDQIAVDAQGEAIFAGTTSSPDFPLATASTFTNGNRLAFVAKLDVSGSNLLFVDFFGTGSESPRALTLDTAGNIYVAGSTSSSAYPTVNPIQTALKGSEDGFITEFGVDGSSMLYSTYLGGSSYDEIVGIAVTPAANIFVAGQTESTDFPTANAYQSTNLSASNQYSNEDSFITELSPGGASFVYSTYFGGSHAFCLQGTYSYCGSYSEIAGLAVDAQGNAYVVGGTSETDFPVTSNAYQGTFPNFSSLFYSGEESVSLGFYSEISLAGALVYSTYFGPTTSTHGYPGTSLSSVAVDASGRVFILGSTQNNADLPVTQASSFCPSPSTCGEDFLLRFDQGSSLGVSILGPPSTNFNAIALDANSNVFGIGSTSLPATAFVNPIETPVSGSRSSTIIMETDPNVSSVLFSTVLDGINGENVSSLALDAQGAVYVGGITSSADFPVNQAAFQQTLGGNDDAFVAKIDVNTAAPAVAIAPSLVQYSIRNVGSSAQSKQVLLRNMGSAPLQIQSITTSGDFAETDTCGSSVAAAGTCTFTVSFNPTASGSRFGTILIQDNAVGSPHFINLSGEGSIPIVAFSAASLTFPNLQVNTPSSAQTLILTNNGNATLNIGSASVIGDFAQTNNCGTSLALGASCQFQITFTPTAGGSRTGTLSLTDNAADSPESITLTGSGYVTMASFSATSLSFAGQALKTASGAQSFTITNTGANAMHILGVSVTGDFAQTSSCGAALAPSASCAVNVTFTPSASGNRTGSVVINDDAQGNPHTISLTGTGSAPVIGISPASLTFDTTSTGSPEVKTLTITNTGNAALSFSGIQMQGDFTQTNNCTSVAPQGSCSMQVSFNPTASGQRAGSVTLTDAAANSPQTVMLTGSGITPVVTLSSGSLSFSPSVVGTAAAAQTVTVTNVGTAALGIGAIQASGDFAQTNNCGTALAAGAACTVSVTANPLIAGARTGTLTITDNASGSPNTVALAATGLDFSMAAASPSATASAGAPATYQLNVNGMGGSFPGTIALSCLGAPANTTCSLSQSTLTPGISSPVTVTVTIGSAATSSARHSDFPLQGLLGVWFLEGNGIGLLSFAALRRRRLTGKQMLLLAAQAGVLCLALTGCGGGSTPSSNQTTGGSQTVSTSAVPSGTYTLTVSAISGSLQHDTQITLKVQ